MKIYIAGPLFNEMELRRNCEVRDMLRELGFETFLPQEDGGISYDQIQRGAPVEDTRRAIFENDVAQIRNCDILLALLDGRVPDEGTCIEIGIAYTLGKKCIGYLTDQRSLDRYGQSLMIDGCLITTARSLEELSAGLTEYLDA